MIFKIIIIYFLYIFIIIFHNYIIIFFFYFMCMQIYKFFSENQIQMSYILVTNQSLIPKLFLPDPDPVHFLHFETLIRKHQPSSARFRFEKAGVWGGKCIITFPPQVRHRHSAAFLTLVRARARIWNGKPVYLQVCHRLARSVHLGKSSRKGTPRIKWLTWGNPRESALLV